MLAQELRIETRSLEDVFLELTGRELRVMTRPWPAPSPGAAPLPRMVAAQAGLELRTLLRNGEQLLLTLIIPVLLLVVFSSEALISVGRGSRIGFIAPGILALAVHVHLVHQPGHRHRVRAQVRRAQAARRHPAVQAPA